MNFAPLPATRCPPRNRLFSHSDDVIVENEEPQLPLPYAMTAQEQVPLPIFLPYSQEYCSTDGLPFYQVLDSCITDPFIEMKELQNLNGIIRPKTKFIGRLLKLERNLIWHQRTFTVDGPFFSCFHPERVGTVVRRPPLDVPSTKMIDTVLPDGEDFWEYSPKMILPIASFRGIYLLKGTSVFNSWQVPTVHRLIGLAQTCASGLADPCEDLRWVNMLRQISPEGKINLANFRCLVNNSVLNVFMVVHDNRFYLMRAHSEDELMYWITVLCAKWIIFNDNWKYYTMESECVPPVFV